MQPPPSAFSPRVLIVEDDPDTADTLALLLRFWDYEVAVAYDGPEALDAIPTFQPDVVFLDIQLATMDGCDVARQLRRLPGMDKALLVAITGHGYEADVRRCKEAGIDCHFLKPVEPAILREVLAKAEKLDREKRQLVCSLGADRVPRGSVCLNGPSA
jgi:CheY-like chemotaxis protein